MLRLINDKPLKLFLCRLYYETSFGEKLIKAFADKEKLGLSDAYSGAIGSCLEKPMRTVKGLSNMKFFFDNTRQPDQEIIFEINALNKGTESGLINKYIKGY